MDTEMIIPTHRPLYRRGENSQNLSGEFWRQEKTLTPAEIQTPDGHYTDHAIPVPPENGLSVLKK
jgi:hypothetical protein